MVCDGMIGGGLSGLRCDAMVCNGMIGEGERTNGKSIARLMQSLREVAMRCDAMLCDGMVGNHTHDWDCDVMRCDAMR